MIANLIPYPKMKDSGVEWLGEVPAHWTVKRGKALFHCVDVRSSIGEEELLTVSSERGVVSRSSATVTMFKAESYAGYKLCWPGDLVINSLWAWARGLGVSRHHGIISSAYGVYRLRPPYTEYSAYFHELVRSTPFNWELQVRSKGIWISRLQLTDEAFLRAPFPLPPPEEQAVIACYLDHADRRIRRYIRAKQKLITLLEEQKQALIHQAVIRGLDPNVRLKPSGVEWLGDVPEHWEVRRLKYAVSFTGGGTPSKAAATFWSGHIPWVSPKDMTRAQLNDTADHITNDAVAASATSIVAPGAVLIVVRSGILRRTIPVAINTVPMALNQDMKALRPKDGIAKSEYLLVLIQGNESFLLREWTKHGATVESIEHGFLANSRVPLPPLPEQAAIVRFLDEEAANIDDTINRSRRQIELLSEYRTRLIADVVTGKLDVREAAASLLEEADERVPLDEGVPLADDVVDNLYHRVGRGAGNGK